MKKIAILSFENPFIKPNDGAKNDMKTRIQALTRDKLYDIDLYVFNKLEEDFIDINNREYNINNFYQYKVKKVGIKNLFSGFPISVYKRYTTECCEELKKHSYDTIIYEGEHMALYRLRGVANAKKHILREHDIESIYRYELSKSAPSLKYKIGQLMESMLYKKMEKNIDTYFDDILFISKSEKEYFEKLFYNSKCRFIFMPPATTHFSEKPEFGKKKSIIVYFGNMELENNVLSILWFIKEVFSIIIENDNSIELHIIGNISENNRRKLSVFSSNVKVLGYVDNLNKEIEKAALIASPVLYGAGVKIKVIDALSYGQVVVATEKAIEGTELKDKKHLIVENNPQKLAEECISIIRHRDLYKSVMTGGLEFVKKYHSIDAQAYILKNVLNE